MKTSSEDTLRALLSERILVLDGAMGTMLQQANLGPDDFGGEALEGCNENLSLTRPDVIQGVHQAYFEAGADIVETNTFGATPLVLAEYGLADQCRQINRESVRLARAAADAAGPNVAGRQLFVAGSIGPTTKALTVTGGTTLDELVAGYHEQALGLLEGGADLLMIETAQDTLNMKAAAFGVEAAFNETGQRLPVILSATIEPMGSMLAGQSIDAWYTSIEHLQPLAVGMNCATGPEFMTDHIRTLSELATCHVSVYPNAGLPDEEGHYPEDPEALAAKLERFVDAGWVNLVGGCCGTTPDHIRRIRDMVDGRPPRKPREDAEAAVSGIERATIDKDNRPILVGERTNVIGSLKFKRLVEGGQWEAASEVGRAQVKRGAQIVDVCLSHTDRDEVPDVEAFYPQITRKVKAPLMIDSTDAEAIEAALRHCQGKAIVNSINLEDGLERFDAVCPLLRQYGAAVVVGCIDDDPDQGMAISQERKLAVARRSFELLTGKYQIPARDIIFDPLVFPCGTGDETYVGSAGQTVEGTRLITREFPECSTILGISNVSFGLPEAGREMLNSVFLHDCVAAGLTFAIVNTQGIERYPEIPERERELCRNLLYSKGDDPLGAFVAHFRGKKAKKARSGKPQGAVEQRLAQYVVEGTKEWLLEDLDQLLPHKAPLDIINGPLMEGMAKVGELFGNNELIVAEVLQSAEVMKAAVDHLEPHMSVDDQGTKGKVVLATVKGDVHDIGKNLVEIILGNNGYQVIDLGIKTPPAVLVEAAREHQPDIIGLSGLLVKSAQQMVTTAEDLRKAGIQTPIVVGGAALSARFTATKIAPAYEGPVAYARDAMGGLAIMDQILGDPAGFRQTTLRSQEALREAKPSTPAPLPTQTFVPVAPVAARPIKGTECHQISAPARELFDWINPKMLYNKHMGLRGNVESLLAAGDAKAVGLQELWDDLLAVSEQEEVLAPRGVWRFLYADAQGDTVHVYDSQDAKAPLESFTFRRQAATPGRCLSDYLPGRSDGRDTVAMFCVTAGQGVREYAKRLKEEGQYVRSHAIQALALETAEALAEKLHADIRAKWGIVDGPLSKLEVFKAQYQGCRYSFGYPACPDLEDQEKLWRLLDPGQIGVELTEGFMMDPEASVSALVFHHPEANYFAV